VIVIDEKFLVIKAINGYLVDMILINSFRSGAFKEPCKAIYNLYYIIMMHNGDGSGAHIMLRDLLTQKSVNKKTVTGFRYPRACRFRKYQFENRSWEILLPTFFKT
jgi:hypothetical protein